MLPVMIIYQIPILLYHVSLPSPVSPGDFGDVEIIEIGGISNRYFSPLI
jgi:hypothetical protein